MSPQSRPPVRENGRKEGLFPGKFPEPASADHTGDAQRDEGDAQPLSHVERHALLKAHLLLLDELDEEAEGEYRCQAEAEEDARPHRVAVASVEQPAGKEDDQVGECLVELCRVTCERLAVVHEDEAPGHVGRKPHYLGVHQVAQTDAACRERRRDGNVVEHADDVQLRPSDVEPQRNHQAQRAAVARQTLVAREYPSRGGMAEGENHLQRMGEVEARLIEEAVPQAGTDEDAHETVEEEWFEKLTLDALLAVEPLHDEVGEQQSDDPAQRVVADVDRPDAEKLDAGVPRDEGECVHIRRV